MKSKRILQLAIRSCWIARPSSRGINPIKKHDGLICPRLTNLDFHRQYDVVLHSRQLFTTSVRPSVVSKDEIRKSIDRITEKFMEAKELLEDARESVGTVYFSADMTEAKEAVSETLSQYENLLETLSDEQRQDVVRTIGLRMEELKAQEQAISED